MKYTKVETNELENFFDEHGNAMQLMMLEMEKGNLPVDSFTRMAKSLSKLRCHVRFRGIKCDN